MPVSNWLVPPNLARKTFLARGKLSHCRCAVCVPEGAARCRPAPRRLDERQLAVERAFFAGFDGADSVSGGRTAVVPPVKISAPACPAGRTAAWVILQYGTCTIYR